MENFHHWFLVRFNGRVVQIFNFFQCSFQTNSVLNKLRLDFYSKKKKRDRVEIQFMKSVHNFHSCRSVRTFWKWHWQAFEKCATRILLSQANSVEGKIYVFHLTVVINLNINEMCGKTKRSGKMNWNRFLSSFVYCVALQFFCLIHLYLFLFHNDLAQQLRSKESEEGIY